MNYRHRFHAGNFADVFKHAVYLRVLAHLNKKDAAYRVLDTHAGSGRYTLADTATKPGEFRGGIARIYETPPADEAGELLADYLRIVRETNDGGELRHYPGSPAIAAAVAGRNKLVFCEADEDAFSGLAKFASRHRNAAARHMDGYQALKAMLPFPERRGVVLIDPPFEHANEFANIAAGIGEAMQRFATATYLVWYPLKNRHDTAAAVRRIARAAEGREALKLEIEIAPPRADGALTACGILAINPPWTLARECHVMLPALRDAMAQDRAAARIEPMD